MGRNQLDKLFSLVVVGEFNSGKSSFLNALLGNKFLEEGITPTTQKICVIKYGNSVYKTTETSEIDSIYLPIEWLKEINVVDTPGTNAIVRTHEAITETFIPQSDLILFVTSVERPFSESERLFLKRIQTWSKKVIVIITKIDQLASETELIQVTDFVRKNYAELTRSGALIFPVSARLTLNDKKTKNGEKASEMANFNQFKDLETYIHETLDATERLQLKLSTPLGICSKLVASYQNHLNQLEELTRDDCALLKEINQDIEIFENDLKRDFKYQESRVDNTILRLRERGESYLDNILRLSNITMLVRDEKMKTDFELNVVQDTTTQIDSLVSDIIDWLVEKNTKHWTHILKSLKARAHAGATEVHSDHFVITRKDLLKTIGDGIHSIVDSYDKKQESVNLSKKVQQSMFQAVAVAGASALGMGALLSVSLLDITGILGASALAATGLCIIPYRRVTVKKEFNSKINDYREKIISSLRNHFENEVHNNSRKIRDAISPFSTFVQKEEKRHKEAIQQLDELTKQIKELQAQVSKLSDH